MKPLTHQLTRRPLLAIEQGRTLLPVALNDGFGGALRR